MRIPSGDLAPVRKRRRYGKRRNPVPVLLGVVLVAAIAVGGYLLRRDDSAAGRSAQAARCPSSAPAPSATPVLPAATAVRLSLLNGTGRNGLARIVGSALARRGFVVSGMGNAPTPLTGASRITYGTGSGPAAQLVDAQVIGAQVSARSGAAGVELTLGSSFVRLRTAAEVRAYLQPAAATPAPAKACG